MYKKLKNLYTLLRIGLLAKRIASRIQRSIRLIIKHFIQLLGPAVIRKNRCSRTAGRSPPRASAVGQAFQPAGLGG